MQPINISSFGKFAALSILLLLNTACGGGGGGGSSSDSPTPPTSQSPSQTVVISGVISYDRVPHKASTNGLDYDNTFAMPAREVAVYLLDSNDQVLGQTQTNSLGEYQFSVASNTNVAVLAQAQTVGQGAASWDFSVVDNTANNAIYGLIGSLVSSGTVNSTRDLHAASGWTGSSYGNERAAAPFAILDTVYDAIQTVVAVDPNVQLPTSEVRWSELNQPSSGELSNGRIGTSFYSPEDKVIYLLGQANVDTDEYDDHVIAHEWGHYFEDNLSRSDSLGGNHGPQQRLDMRVAMSEGWGNAFSAMALADPVYRDSASGQQQRGFALDVEDNNVSPEGWFNEASVQSILYDVFDTVDDGADQLSLGFGPIYDVLVSDNYRNTSLFTGIHLFANQLRQRVPSSSAAINALLSGQDIAITDSFGNGESNSGGSSASLPIYTELLLGGSEELCLDYQFGTENKLGNFRYVWLPGLAAGRYTITISVTDPSISSADPDFYLYKNGVLQVVAQEFAQQESWTGELTGGDYLLDFSDFGKNNACFNVSIN